MVVTTAGTREQLTADAAFTDLAAPLKSICITAETDNTSIVVVGGSTVVAALATRRGTPLAAGQSITYYVDDLSDIYVDALVNGEGVTFSYEA